MTKKLFSSLTVFVVATALFLTVTSDGSVGGMVYAVNGLDKANARAEERMMKTRQRMASPSAGLQRSCESREDTIVSRMSQLVRLSENMLSVFDKHLARVQNYYLTVVVPAGSTVANYDDLVADTAAKKAVVQTALANAQADVDDFSCTTGDPIAHLATFRTDMQTVKTALKEYRSSIKNLIVAVRTAAEALETPTPTPTATPTL